MVITFNSFEHLQSLDGFKAECTSDNQEIKPHNLLITHNFSCVMPGCSFALYISCELHGY